MECRLMPGRIWPIPRSDEEAEELIEGGQAYTFQVGAKSAGRTTPPSNLGIAAPAGYCPPEQLIRRQGGHVPQSCGGCAQRLGKRSALQSERMCQRTTAGLWWANTSGQELHKALQTKGKNV